MSARERLARIKHLEREVHDERYALLTEMGWSKIDERGLRWRDPVQGDAVTATTAVYRVEQESRA